MALLLVYRNEIWRRERNALPYTHENIVYPAISTSSPVLARNCNLYKSA